jgi:hypothetical protein
MKAICAISYRIERQGVMSTTVKTRAEHLAWCKERALAEANFYPHDPKQGIISMMSDLGKHPETNDETLRMLCMFQLTSGKNSKAEVMKFINGFN